MLADPALDELLRRTSRSMYLSLIVLPVQTRQAVSLAYLLARAADSIADTPAIGADARDGLLADLVGALRGAERKDFLARLDAALTGGRDPERALLQRLPQALDACDRCADRERIARLLQTLVSGMRADLTRPRLASMDELEDYTYRVAGCVGEFWTDLHHAHLPRLRLPVDDAIALGKGLQMCNVLRDVAADAALGRCYLPADRLAAAGLGPDDLRDPGCWPRVRPVYLPLLQQGRAWLRQGRRVLRAVPRRHLGVHLACRWPLELGLATFDRLAVANPLAERVKVPRRALYGLLVGSLGRALICAR